MSRIANNICEMAMSNRDFSMDESSEWKLGREYARSMSRFSTSVKIHQFVDAVLYFLTLFYFG